MSDEKLIEIFGEIKNISEWSLDNRCQVSSNGFKQRLWRGWPPEKALLTPQKTFDNLIGKKFDRLFVIEIASKDKWGHSTWKCICDCGTHTIVNHNNLIYNKVHSCGCYKADKIRANKWKGYGEISQNYWRSLERGAVARNIQFNISIKQGWNLFLKQNKRCALTNELLSFEYNKRKKIYQTASLDRINSNFGYTEGNIQWLHKEINILKNDLDNEKFIALCNSIKKQNKDIAICSGHFDPIGCHHLRLFEECSNIGLTICIVNSDEQIKLKKNTICYPLNERIQLLSSIKHIDEVIVSIDTDRSVNNTLKVISNKYPSNNIFFCNGGDVTIENCREQDVCNQLGIKLLFNIGGEKSGSSTNIINRIINQVAEETAKEWIERNPKKAYELIKY